MVWAIVSANGKIVAFVKIKYRWEWHATSSKVSCWHDHAPYLLYFKRVECRRATSLCVSNSNVNNIINEKDTIRNLIAYTETLKGYEVQEHGLCVIIHKRWLGALTAHQWMRYLWGSYFWSYLHFHCSFLGKALPEVSSYCTHPTRVDIHPC